MNGQLFEKERIEPYLQFFKLYPVLLTKGKITIVKKNIIRVAASTLLFWLGWPPNPVPIFLFVSLIPLLQIESRSILHKWILALTTLFLINTTTTYWIYNTIPVGAFLVHLTNSILFSIPFLLYYASRIKLTPLFAGTLFISSWLSFEFLHLNWQLGYPFLTIGNGLSKYPMLFQWYEYSGVLGGSLWIITTNILLSELILNFKQKSLLALYIVTVLLPIVISIAIFFNYSESNESISVASIQTAMDCYNEKYAKETDWVVDQHINLTKGTNEMDFILWPETAITNAGLKNNFNEQPILLKMKNLLGNSKSIILSGAIFYEDHGLDYDKEIEAFYYPPMNSYLTVHNSVIAFNGNSPIALLRSKEKLVPFEERIPYPGMLTWVSSTIGKLGGFKFSTSSDGIKMISRNDYKATSLICYEILFGEDLAKMSRKGANVFFLHLNEGWYHNTVGAKQFLYYTSVRAVETRRSIARSSNYGFSALINQKGEIIDTFKNIEVSGVISGKLSVNKKSTFYTAYGDFLGRLAFIIFILLLFLILLKLIKRKFQLF